MNIQELNILLEKLKDGSLSQEEKVRLDEWESLFEHKEGLTEKLPEEEQQQLKLEMWNNIERRTVKQEAPVVKMERKRYANWKWIAASFIGLLFGGFLVYQLVLKNPKVDQPGIVATTTDVAPGSDKAVLTLANGEKVVLDSTKGTIKKQGGVTIINLGGKLSYEEHPTTSQEEVAYNTISTPKGGQYQLILADGTTVWLNAASSLKYPTAFVGDSRVVELTGEGYFEVAKNANKPFHVKVSGQDVEVVGTHFNINAYEDEATVRTTLLEGSVKVTKGNTTKMLEPGQQTQLAKDGNLQLIKEADTEEATAWINGNFILNGSDVAAFMRQVSRWYDVDVIYEGKVPEGHFKGKTSRSLNLSQMFKVLEYMGINYKIEGKKIIIKAD